jgi:hypothetical protein
MGQCGCLGDQKKPVSPARNSNPICSAHDTIHAMLSQVLPNNFPQYICMPFSYFQSQPLSNPYSFTDFPYHNNTTNPVKSQCSLSCNIPNSIFTSSFLVSFPVHFMFFSNTYIMHFPRSKKSFHTHTKQKAKFCVLAIGKVDDSLFSLPDTWAHFFTTPSLIGISRQLYFTGQEC